MPQITIQGHAFEVPHDPGISAGVPMDEGHVHTLQQTRLENIRNNMAARIKKLMNGSDTLTDEQVSAAQADVDKYAQDYKFGQRTAGGGPRVVRDPVEREMVKLAKEDVVKAFRAKYNEPIKGDSLNAAVEKLLEARHDDYAKRARRAIADREKVGAEVLEAAGI